MKIPVLIYLIFINRVISIAQSPEELISRVKESQNSLQTVYYKLERHDTLVTGMVRTITGEAKLSALPTDVVFGFRFWSIRDGVHSESIYDGNAAFYIDHDSKTFLIDSRKEMIEAITGRPGGQVILPDLMRIDTSKAVGYELKEDEQYFYLKIFLPDIDLYDVRERSKTLTIDKKLLLPIGVRYHQETTGKVQDLNFRIKQIRVNDPSLIYDFASQRYPENYKPQEQSINKKLFSLNGKSYPSFTFTSFDGKPISSDIFKGKVVLLDFWELWCGPCIASMPKVEALYQKFRSKGFDVYSIMHEKENLETAKALIQKMKVNFVIGTGNEQSKNSYSINAVPVYILISKTGKIVFVSEGYSDLLEEEIQKNL